MTSFVCGILHFCERLWIFGTLEALCLFSPRSETYPLFHTTFRFALVYGNEDKYIYLREIWHRLILFVRSRLHSLFYSGHSGSRALCDSTQSRRHATREKICTGNFFVFYFIRIRLNDCRLLFPNAELKYHRAVSGLRGATGVPGNNEIRGKNQRGRRLERNVVSPIILCK